MKRDLIVYATLLLLAILPVAWLLHDGKSEDDSCEDSAVCDNVRMTDPTTAVPEPIPTRATGKKKSATSPTRAKKSIPSPVRSTGRAAIPTFVGYESSRYQQHDILINRLVTEFNENRMRWAAATKAQAANIRLLTTSQVKAQMIQESGGNDARSRAAWNYDPLQVNVPGDWNPYKKYLGLRKPRRRNEGSLEKNVKAGIMLLSRKGFGTAGQPAANNPLSTFDGWHPALARYNGRSTKTIEGKPYGIVYADRVLMRAGNGRKQHVPIAINVKRK